MHFATLASVGNDRKPYLFGFPVDLSTQFSNIFCDYFGKYCKVRRQIKGSQKVDLTDCASPKVEPLELLFKK